jgi:biopolymer transport protein ExbB
MLRSRVAIATAPACLSVTHAVAQEVASRPATLTALPRDLSPWGMFLAADRVVQAVMIGLFIASVLTWTVWLAKTIELVAERRRLRQATERLEQARALAELGEEALASKGAAHAMVRAALVELPSKRPPVAASRVAPAFSPPSAPPRPSSVCSARCGAS